MIDLSEVSYREILDCIVDASLGRLSPYFQEYARHEITSLANADGELPQAAVILQDVLAVSYTHLTLPTICSV